MIIMDKQMAIFSGSDVQLKPVMNLLEMPIELVEEILCYLSYDQISHFRLVCRAFNRSCSQLLNRGFMKVEKFHGQCHKKVKAQLPRRESERRSHPLSRHCEILSAIETRLSLLSMTYMRYVESNLCCFIPGKVVDEIYRVLRFVQNNPNPPRIAELLQELRDISSMAMEYFEEKIAPNLKSKMGMSSSALFASVNSARTPLGYANSYRSSLLALPPSGSSSLFSPSPSALASPSDYGEEISISKINQSLKIFSAHFRKEASGCKAKVKEAEKQVQAMSTRMAEQDRLILELNQRVIECEKRQNATVAAVSIPAVNDKEVPESRKRKKGKAEAKVPKAVAAPKSRDKKPPVVDRVTRSMATKLPTSEEFGKPPAKKSRKGQVQ